MPKIALETLKIKGLREIGFDRRILRHRWPNVQHSPKCPKCLNAFAIAYKSFIINAMGFVR